MSIRRKMVVAATALALGAPAASAAQDPGFTYIEGGLFAGFVNDVGQAGSFTSGNTALELETDAGGGAFIGGGWAFGDSMHLFGEYSSASQDLEVRGGPTPLEGDFTLTRWRVGVGYAHPLSPTTHLYGRVSLDGAELSDLDAAGFALDAEGDDTGFGSEIGLIWAATPGLQLQGHVRYTSVGEVATEGDETFAADVLVGLTGRWSFRPDFSLVTGYEYGKITTWNVGVRYAF